VTGFSTHGELVHNPTIASSLRNAAHQGEKDAEIMDGTYGVLALNLAGCGYNTFQRTMS